MNHVAQALIVMAAALVLNTVVHETAFPDGVPPGNIKMSIEKIHYEGNNGYALTLSLMNEFPRDVQVQGLEERFFIQTDRGWAALRARERKRPATGLFLLSRGAKKEWTLLLNIPLTIQDIFRTYEGDISLMHQYRLRYVDPHSGIEYQKADEAYYWITPGSKQWILREGM